MGRFWLRPCTMKKILNIHRHLNLEQRDDTIYSTIYPKLPKATIKYGSIGIHPWYIPPLEEINWENFVEEASKNKIIVIGECGLDTFSEIPLDTQIKVFQKQIEVSEMLKKPLLIHMVRTTDELLAIRNQLNPTQPWIIHGFRGKPQLAQQYYRHEMYLSIGSKFNTKTVLAIPLNKILLETDESDETIDSLVDRIAQLKKISSQTLIKQIYENTESIFFR